MKHHCVPCGSAIVGFLALCHVGWAGVQTFTGPLATTRPLFFEAAGGVLPIETFEAYAGGTQISELKSIGIVILEEDAAGEFLPLPAIATNSPVTPPKWLANTGPGRPAWSPLVIVPLDAGDVIHSFGLAGAQGDFVRIEAFDACGDLIGSVDQQAISPAFAGIVSSVPIHKIIVTPLGNFDGINGMDDFTVGTDPPAITPIECAGDANCDAIVDAADLNRVLGAFGCTENCCSDLTGDGLVNALDLNVVLANFGTSCQ